MKLTDAQIRSLKKAAKRERGNICPTVCEGAAEEALIQSLERKGLIEWDGRAPRINDAGRSAVGHQSD